MPAKKKQIQTPLPFEGESAVDSFRKKEIRKVFHGKEWWFSVKDVLEALVDVADGTKYIAELRKRDSGLNERYPEITRTLPFATAGGVQKTTFINIEGIFRIMQSVPSKKAEPFKKWLAKVGFERLQEVRDPALAIMRAITLYRSQGYPDEWIEARIRNKASRELLVAEWHKRGMRDYMGLLTDAVSVGTFELTTAQHKELKGLKPQHSLRDNMTPIELTLTTLGEQATHEITKSTNPKDFREHYKVAEQGGRIAGDARRKIEAATNQQVVSKKNYLSANKKELADKDKDLGDMVKRLLGSPKEE